MHIHPSRNITHKESGVRVHRMCPLAKSADCYENVGKKKPAWTRYRVCVSRAPLAGREGCMIRSDRVIFL